MITRTLYKNVIAYCDVTVKNNKPEISAEKEYTCYTPRALSEKIALSLLPEGKHIINSFTSQVETLALSLDDFIKYASPIKRQCKEK